MKNINSYGLTAYNFKKSISFNPKTRVKGKADSLFWPLIT